MLRSFLLAVQFLTRIPVRLSDVREDELGRASAYFPLIGTAIGAVAAVIFWAVHHVLPASTSIILILVFMTIITNALHEDGLADALDGFGGGWTKDKALSIMKDSRIGSFGALGLIFLVISKYNLMGLIEPNHLWRWLLFAPTAARWSTLPLCLTLDYARDEGQGKAVARKIPDFAVIFGTLTLFAASAAAGLYGALLGLAASAGVIVVTGLYYRHRVGGVTGDCLGATNQLVEVAVYLSAVLLTAKGGM